ncbi:MAG: zinc ribbon domain-containing protein [Phycisphaerae bacterium]|nr:zinc ribbon domain-containing protein [Phycisphaerae bacterium]
MSRKISEKRKAVFYVGTGLMILGAVLFLSVFVTAVMHFGDFSHFEARAKSSMFRAFGGMGILILGVILRAIGTLGIAGSGVVLNPQKARQDLEPFSRMAGGVVKDVLDEADVHLGGKAEKVVMIKCPACGKLNEEDSKFCQECGKEL